MYTRSTLIVLAIDKDKQKFECNKAPNAIYYFDAKLASRPGLEIPN